SVPNALWDLECSPPPAAPSRPTSHVGPRLFGPRPELPSPTLHDHDACLDNGCATRPSRHITIPVRRQPTLGSSSISLPSFMPLSPPCRRATRTPRL